MSDTPNNAHLVAVVIPCYKVTSKILDVILRIGPIVDRIYVIDDCCPDHSGQLVRDKCRDARVIVMTHSENQGVGGAVMTGYQAALKDGMDVIVKIDGDGQMDPELIPDFISPIISKEADYTKGNRFFNLEEIRAMPKVRIFGNAVLSFMNKLSSGYWDIFDPTNGYTAMHRGIAMHLPFDKISRRYFFETDLLFRLNTLRAVVIDIPMSANYGDEVSNLKISNVLGEFFFKHIRNFLKRIFYSYYLRGMSLASIELPFGVLLLVLGGFFGGYHWIESMRQGVSTPAGTVMLSALPMIVGIQFILAFIGYDISSVPRHPFQLSRQVRRKSVSE